MRGSPSAWSHVLYARTDSVSGMSQDKKKKKMHMREAVDTKQNIYGDDDDDATQIGMWGKAGGRTHRRDREARAAVEPVIVAQLVDLDPLPPTRRIRHRLCHDQRLWFALGAVGQVAQDAGGEVEVLLEGELVLRGEQR